MKQLITIKHIILVILILLIILSLFGENLREGWRIKRKKKNHLSSQCIQHTDLKSCNKSTYCGWKDNKCGNHDCEKQKNKSNCHNINQSCKWRKVGLRHKCDK
jgi:hypothetical protein